ncbi:ribosome biogenesis GTPase YqeH [Alkalicoccus luteus]|uniref:Ribosome biogenesis GTPase YqeH n=1 Tax=Alkalicoccus luteus TaxID=1237094 RepID=A0A969PLR5_9BACI|nr:ribosome biogenesis GTPase YqeH [Alkalicoccus luteus]NJP36521.1 ribosome biogenesis GTPase YqeH [Alkalicoccus luteus]
MGSGITCAGCGIELQTENSSRAGYAPAQALEKETVICRRCFRLKHYNEVQDVHLTDDDFLKILNELSSRDALIVKIVDIFDFSGSWLDGIQRFSGSNDVLLVGNKSDLLPKSVRKSKVVNWMKRQAKEFGLKPAETLLMSAQTGDGVEETAAWIDKLRKGKDVYVVGATNTGKSSFINQLIRRFSDGESPVDITTSNIPGTTLDRIDIPLDETSTLYDTPGIINRHQIAHLLNKEDLKTISPKKEIKQLIHQLNPGQTLYFGGLARMDFVKGNPGSFVVNMSNELPVHRTKLENADQLYEKHAGGMLAPPTGKETAFPAFKKSSWKLPAVKTDLVISGLGWITVHAPGAEVMLHVPEGVQVSMRESIY